jgi:hypothetical protein
MRRQVAGNLGRHLSMVLIGSLLWPSSQGVLGVSQTYVFDVVGGEVKNLHAEGSAVILTANAGVFALALQPAAISGTVLGVDGNPVAGVGVNLSLNGNTYCCSWTSSAGKFQADYGQVLPDGTWEVRAFGIQNSLTVGGSSTETVTVTNGRSSSPVTLHLRATNVSGVVSGVNGVSPGNFVQVRKLLDNGSYQYLQNTYFNTDSQGKFAFALDSGRYQFTANEDLKVAGGSSGILSICTVTSGVATTCDIALPPPNVSGTISIGGVSVQGSIELIGMANGGFQYQGLVTTSDAAGNFALKADPGTYQVQIRLFSGISVFGTICTVPVSGPVVCDRVLPGTNLSFNIIANDGKVLTNGAYVYYIKNSGTLGGGGLGLCCLNMNSSVATGDAYFKVPLLDGSYTFALQPFGNNQLIGTAINYIVTVSGGVVTKISDPDGISISAINGIYALPLGRPSISGSVTSAVGNAPVPNTGLDAYSDPYRSYGASTDQNGYFAFSQLPDGTCKVIAHPQFGDSSQADSLPSTVTVTHGSSTPGITLALRTPNISWSCAERPTRCFTVQLALGTASTCKWRLGKSGICPWCSNSKRWKLWIQPSCRKVSNSCKWRLEFRGIGDV